MFSHFFVTRSRQLNEPTNTIEDCGDELIIRSTAYRRLWPSEDTRVEKAKVEKVQRARNTVSLFMQGGNAYDIWAAGKFTEELFMHAQRLLPDAAVVIIHADGTATTTKEKT